MPPVNASWLLPAPGSSGSSGGAATDIVPSAAKQTRLSSVSGVDPSKLTATIQLPVRIALPVDGAGVACRAIDRCAFNPNPPINPAIAPLWPVRTMTRRRVVRSRGAFTMSSDGE